jgi:hypothetical protein
MSYYEKLEICKNSYPFNNWRKLFYADEEDGFYGIEQYSPENCDAAQWVLDELIGHLITGGEDVPAETKITWFKRAVEQLNSLNGNVEGFIETSERDDLCELFDKIAMAAGLNPAEYGGGEGIATEWRNW